MEFRKMGVVLVAVLLAACDATTTDRSHLAGTTAKASASAIGTLTQSQSRKQIDPPFPDVVPVLRGAGSELHQSPHWVGYVFPTGPVAGVRAEWTEPMVTGRLDDEESMWIGVGGWADPSNIIQIGTFGYVSLGGVAEHGVWYERVPGDSAAQYPEVRVDPGDHLYASVMRSPAVDETWQLSIVDVTNGSNFSIDLPFRSVVEDPLFVLEDPTHGPPDLHGSYENFARWGSATFTDMQVCLFGDWLPAASRYGLRFDMVRDGVTLATAGPLTLRSDFMVSQG